ncbi:protein NUCLEAR FUSION DEFECTIVE 4-like [Heracleum sosnowskyi]|uniref:Protein NUCLEAR FUSION DEFECTIVE 4-like n=1 Tax=Heracleum sosnowskyi TaxID=360622 RepID=A0AAD8MR99_9APIA|nr:protein NUCLEAR FUSION DEFECTIVE 4-like [Heracleum sosnowskyi]
MVMTNVSSSSYGLCSFIIQVLRGRWFMMFASILIMAAAGLTYLFGVYSKEIKSTLGYDQSTLNLIGFSKDLGANIGVLSGILDEFAPTWIVLLVGSVMNFAGYFVIWLAVTKRIPQPTVWQMCVYICIGANSQNFVNTGSLVTCVKNFPGSRGHMLGLMKGYVGLSGAIFTQFYLAIYGNDAKSLILLIAWLPALISILFIFSIKSMKISRHPREGNVFFQYLFISLALAFLLMALNIAEKKVSFSHAAYVGSSAAVCVILFSPLLIAIREEFLTWKLKQKQINSIDGANVILEEPPLPVSKSAIPLFSSEETLEKSKVTWWYSICNKPNRGEDYSISQALLSFDMILLFVATFCGLGSSLTTLDNLGQIGESLSYPPLTISTFVSLASIWNYFGRIFSGFVSEKLLTKWRIPRTLAMTLFLVIAAIGDLMIAIPFPGSVYVASLLIGASFGAQLTLLFIIISELFGLKHYAVLFNCGQLASPIGSYVLNVLLVGRLYDNEARRQLAVKGMTRSMVNDLTCIGKECYRLSFLILAAVNAFGAVASFILVMRTRSFYKSDIYQKFKAEFEANERSEMEVLSTEAEKQAHLEGVKK